MDTQQQQLTQDLNILVTLTEKIKDLEATVKQIRERLAANREIGEELKVGDNVIATVVTTGGRFDEAKARNVLSRELQGLITVEKLDPKLAKEHLPDELRAQCSSAQNVTVRLA